MKMGNRRWKAVVTDRKSENPHPLRFASLTTGARPLALSVPLSQAMAFSRLPSPLNNYSETVPFSPDNSKPQRVRRDRIGLAAFRISGVKDGGLLGFGCPMIISMSLHGGMWARDTPPEPGVPSPGGPPGQGGAGVFLPVGYRQRRHARDTGDELDPGGVPRKKQEKEPGITEKGLSRCPTSETLTLLPSRAGIGLGSPSTRSLLLECFLTGVPDPVHLR